MQGLVQRSKNRVCPNKTAKCLISFTEYAKFGRNPPTSNLKQLRRQEENLVLLDLQGGDNVQKLVPKQNDRFNVGAPPHQSDDENNLGPDGAAIQKKPKKGKSAPPQNVNRVQEMTAQLWPMGVVPYFIDKEIYDSTTSNRIVSAMSAIESVSCVMFRELENKPQSSPDSWLHITNPTQERECVHVFSTNDSGTEVILGFDCLHLDEILHSLLHALGFRDEVTHPHRDQYVRVLWNNIQPKYRGLFRIRHEDASQKLVEYDPMSIMHFHDRAFSDNGAATISALVPGLQITPTKTLSQLDIMRLKLAFSHECNKRSIDDLLITCKKSLTPQNINEGDVSHNRDEADDIELKSQENQQEDDNIETNEEMTANKVEAQPEESNENKQLNNEPEPGTENLDEKDHPETAAAGEENDDNKKIPSRFHSVLNYKSRG